MQMEDAKVRVHCLVAHSEGHKVLCPVPGLVSVHDLHT